MEGHHLHAWSIGSERNIVSMHVIVDNWANGEILLKNLDENIKRHFHVYFTTIQIESKDLLDETAVEFLDINKGLSQDLRSTHH